MNILIVHLCLALNEIFILKMFGGIKKHPVQCTMFTKNEAIDDLISQNKNSTFVSFCSQTRVRSSKVVALMDKSTLMIR